MAEENNEIEKEESQSPQLKINDIASAISIIDFASSKGIFTGKDLEAIGGVRNRMEMFINSISEQEPEKTLLTEES